MSVQDITDNPDETAFLRQQEQQGLDKQFLSFLLAISGLAIAIYLITKSK